MKLISIAGLCAALYAGAGTLLWAAQDRLIFHPRAVHPDKRRQFENLQVQFPMPDGAILRGWMRPADAPPPENAPCRLVLYFGGNSEEVSANIQHPLPVPADQLLINYRGFGDSDGKPSNRDLEQDALRLFDQAADRFAIPPEKICVFGRSLGTHMAAFVAAHRPVAPRRAHLPLRQRPEHRPKTIPRFSRPHAAAPSLRHRRLRRKSPRAHALHPRRKRLDCAAPPQRRADSNVEGPPPNRRRAKLHPQ